MSVSDCVCVVCAREDDDDDDDNVAVVVDFDFDRMAVMAEAAAGGRKDARNVVKRTSAHRL